MRIYQLKSGQRFWSCENCFLNLDSNLFIAVNGFETTPERRKELLHEIMDDSNSESEENEAKADAIRKDPEALGYKLEE